MGNELQQVAVQNIVEGVRLGVFIFIEKVFCLFGEVSLNFLKGLPKLAEPNLGAR